jgi:hypothetical protein
MPDFDLAKRLGKKFLALHRTERTDGVLTKERGIPRQQRGIPRPF